MECWIGSFSLYDVRDQGLLSQQLDGSVFEHTNKL